MAAAPPRALPPRGVDAEVFDIGRFFEFAHVQDASYTGRARFTLAMPRSPSQVLYVEVTPSGAL